MRIMHKNLSVFWFVSFILMAISQQASAGIERIDIKKADPKKGGNAGADYPSISFDGRYITFSSLSNDLVDSDQNRYKDIFIYDRKAEKGHNIKRISVNSKGKANNMSKHPDISPDGRYVVFESWVSDLVPGDDNKKSDIFVYSQGNSSEEEQPQIKRIPIGTKWKSGDDASDLRPRISRDGHYITFQSSTQGLVTEDEDSDKNQIYLYDSDNDTIKRISFDKDNRNKGGNAAADNPNISGDGNWVVFASGATNLTPGDKLPRHDHGQPSQIYLYNRDTDTIIRISADKDDKTKEGNGTSSEPVVSDNGRYVAFLSRASNLVNGDKPKVESGFLKGFIFDQVYVYDRQQDTIKRISVNRKNQGEDDSSGNPSISHDGRYIAFESSASNLVPGDDNEKNDIFVYDLKLNKIKRITVGLNELKDQDGDSTNPSLSGDGQWVAFTSRAKNLIREDKSYWPDVFVASVNDDGSDWVDVKGSTWLKVKAPEQKTDEPKSEPQKTVESKEKAEQKPQEESKETTAKTAKPSAKTSAETIKVPSLNVWLVLLMVCLVGLIAIKQSNKRA